VATSVWLIIIIKSQVRKYLCRQFKLLTFNHENFAMHTENNPDFKNVWQLAHVWIGADPDKTNTNDISPELRIAIHRLMHAMYCREITTRWKGYRIFLDNSFFSTIFDICHDLKFIQCLRKSKFDKTYLSKLYVKRNEIIQWCNNVVFLDPPPCWATKNLSSIAHSVNEKEDSDTGWYDRLTELRRRKVICIGLAEQLWQKHPDLTYKEMHEHEIMKDLGYSSKFNFNNFKTLVRPVASEPAKLPGSPLKSEE
jgi:hypothetical protein